LSAKRPPSAVEAASPFRPFTFALCSCGECELVENRGHEARERAKSQRARLAMSVILLSLHALTTPPRLINRLKGRLR
jgi:hypothetical protein